MKKRILAALLCACMALLLFPAAASAATGQQDGLQVSLTADKASYGADDDVLVTVSVTNLNSIQVFNGSLQLLLPSGLAYVSGAGGIIPVNLGAGQTTAFSFTAARAGRAVDLPATGGAPSSPGLWLGLALAAAAVLIFLLVFKKKTRGRVLSAFLCLALLIAFIPGTALAAIITKNFTVTQNITLGGQSYALGAKVSYDWFVGDPAPATYAVTVNNGTGGGSYVAGATVSITADEPAEGMEFSSWTVDSGGVTLDDEASLSTTFTMPANAVEVTANYIPQPLGFASGGNITLTTVLGGVIIPYCIVGEAGNVGPYYPLTSPLDLTGYTDALALARAVPANAVITGLSASFTATVSVPLGFSTATVYAQLYQAAEGSDSYSPVPGAGGALAPDLSGTVMIDDEFDITLTGLDISVDAGSKLILVYYAEVTAGLDIVANIPGAAAGTVTFGVPIL